MTYATRNEIYNDRKTQIYEIKYPDFMTDVQTYRHKDIQVDRQANRQRESKRNKLRETGKDRRTDREKERQSGRNTYRHTVRLTYTLINRHSIVQTDRVMQDLRSHKQAGSWLVCHVCPGFWGLCTRM